MRKLTGFAVLPIIAGLALSLGAYTSSAPADVTSRRDYASSLQQDFAKKRVSNTIVWTSGPEDRQLYLDGPWLDHSTAGALINGGISP